LEAIADRYAARGMAPARIDRGLRRSTRAGNAAISTAALRW